MNNRTIGAVLVVIIVAGAAFWGGMMYGQSKSPARGSAGNFAGRAGGGGRLASGNVAFGTVIAKDSNSITVQLGTMGSTTSSGSGSKIVLYDANTQVGEFKTGSTNDLSVGQSVSVSGSTNSDGSITATTIQIRPANMPRPSGQ